MSDFNEIIHSKKSIRRFSDRKAEKEKEPHSGKHADFGRVHRKNFGQKYRE